MNLSSFPSDLLDLILQYKDASYLAVRLWKCGNRLLNAKLATGLTSITLKQDTFFRFPLPRMLYELVNLRSASILMGDGDSIVRCLTQDMLPKGLTTLEISGRPPQPLPTLDDGPQEEELRFPEVNLALLFPSLTSLTLDAHSELATRIFLASLPTSLATLKVLTLDLQIATILPLLPQSLVHLHANLELFYGRRRDFWSVNSSESSNRSIEAVLSDFSLPCLETIDRIVISTTQRDQGGIVSWPALLPRGLRSFAVLLNIAPAQVAMLPRSITHLDVSCTPLDWKSFLAPNGASIGALGVDGTASNSMWPSSLQSLNVLLNTFESGALLAFPRNLKALVLDFAPGTTNLEGVALLADELPPQLQTLVLSKMRKEDGCLVIQGTLPSSLATFMVLGVLQLSSKSIGSLPSSLAYLQLASSIDSYLTAEPPWLLPPALTTLRLKHWAQQWLQKIPRSVTSLTIEELSKLPSSVSGVILFSDLPANLKHLKVVAVWPNRGAFEISPTSFTHLPFLETLELSDEINASTAICPLLPRTLRHLHLSMTSISIVNNETDLHHLPPNLVTCNLGSRGLVWNMAAVTSYWPLTALASVPLEHRTMETRNELLKRWRESGL